MGRHELLLPATASAEASSGAIRADPVRIGQNFFYTRVVEVFEAEATVVVATGNLELLFVRPTTFLVFD